MKTSTLFVAGLGLIGLTLAGCGGSSGGGKSSSSSSVAQSSTSSSSSSISSSSSSVATHWELVWSDEFDGDSIDSSKWSHEVNCAGGGNNELQCYTARAENSYVADGQLHIVARAETYSGPAHFDDDPAYNAEDTSKTQPYTSARLRSKHKGDWKYGRMEISAKMPHGQGIWPAIWMMPTESVYGPWPASGEIDIFEAVNLNTPLNGGINNEVHGTLHYGRFWPNNTYTGDKTTPANNIWETFNTYAVEWEEGEIRWYVGNEHFATQTSDGWFTYYWDGQVQGFKRGEGSAPFDQLFHLIMNLAVGGDWPGAPNDATIFPQTMTVDYVRVYRCSLDPTTGKGCATHVNPEITPLTGATAPEQTSTDLYRNGAQTLSFTVSGQPVNNTLIPAFYDGGVAGNVVSDPAHVMGDQVVWDLMFNGAPGNAFLTTGDMSAVEGVNNGFRMVNMADYGELKFDMLVEAIEPETELLIKLDSGWPSVSYKSIEIPPVGEWTSVSVPFRQLLPNNIQPGQVNLNLVTNPFVIEPAGGTAHVKLNNIRVTCLGDCGVAPALAGVSSVLTETFVVYENGEVGANWDFGIGKWDNDSGHVTIGEVSDPVRGEVIDIKFGTSNNNGLAFIQANSPKNATAFAQDGYLEFDLKVISYGSNTSGLVVKAESGPATGTGDYVITPPPAVGEWQTVRVNVADMLAHPGTNSNFNLAAFNTPFVFFPVWDDQHGVHVQVDNIRWVLP